jgi:cellulose synthase/poly-beta-1,6-N-acetylglucosamine synthase-like glycosyltransferase
LTAFIVFSFCLAIQIGYWALLTLGFRRQLRRAATVPPTTAVPISVIVAARNEADQLPALLRSLAAQTYDRFEVLIVDDGSTDATADIVREQARSDDRFRLVATTPAEPRKKNALRAGIEEATFERLAFTDADCRPGAGWLSSLAACSADRDTVVAGYSPFDRGAGMVNAVSRYETFLTGFLTAAAIGLGRPYMAVGRNLSYSKELFRRIGGFDHSAHLLSGDDDLFVQEAARRGASVLHTHEPESQVPTAAPESWSEWIRQKRRHASAGRYYRPSIKAHLLAFHVTGHAMWLAPIVAGLPGLALLAGRLVVQRVALTRPAAVLGERDLLMLQPVWELLYALYNVLVAPAGLFLQPGEWRTGGERQVG